MKDGCKEYEGSFTGMSHERESFEGAQCIPLDKHPFVVALDIYKGNAFHRNGVQRTSYYAR